MARLRALDRELYEDQGAIRVLGVPLPRRMLVARLAHGEIWVWSPNRLDRALEEELAHLGQVRHLVAPSRMHHAYLEEWRAAYPEARLWAAPGLAAKRRDLRVDGELAEQAPEAWGGAFELIAVEGAPKVSEVALYHRATRTAILCDLVFHIGPAAPLLTRLAMRLNGGYGRLGPTRVMRSLFEDPAATRRSVERILTWDFERLLMAHGEAVEHGGRQALRAALASI